MIAFACAGETLVGTLDDGLDDTHDGAPGRTGLLIVSGGNEIRIGAHRGMALLAQGLAARGIPVFRFDRRGIGDSTGTNDGFRASAADIACAAKTFREAAGIERLVGFGNCDAATALALFGAGAGINLAILANPWVIESDDDLPSAAAIRARYADKLRNPREWWRLLRGGVDLGKIVRGLRKVSGTSNEQSGLANEVLAALETWKGRATILLARRDNTALAFAAAAGAIDPRIRVERLDSASHSFAGVSDAAWLAERIVAALDRA